MQKKKTCTDVCILSDLNFLFLDMTNCGLVCALKENYTLYYIKVVSTVTPSTASYMLILLLRIRMQISTLDSYRAHILCSCEPVQGNTGIALYKIDHDVFLYKLPDS
jgi:hypothetical protein